MSQTQHASNAEEGKKTRPPVIEVSEDIHRELKSRAVAADKKLKEFTDETLRRGLGLGAPLTVVK